MQPLVRADCRLHDYIKECWRNDYCWQAHDPCPDGLPKYRPWWRQLFARLAGA